MTRRPQTKLYFIKIEINIILPLAHETIFLFEGEEEEEEEEEEKEEDIHFACMVFSEFKLFKVRFAFLSMVRREIGKAVREIMLSDRIRHQQPSVKKRGG